jgi:hypothetical protein
MLALPLEKIDMSGSTKRRTRRNVISFDRKEAKGRGMRKMEKFKLHDEIEGEYR